MDEERDDAQDERNVEHTLLHPFKYDHGGQAALTAVNIQMRPPTGRNSEDCAALKQAFWRATDRDDEDSGESDGSKEFDPTHQDVMIILSMSGKVDMPEVTSTAKRLFIKGKTLYVNGEEKMTGPLWDEMSVEDVDTIVGKYILLFVIASSLRRAREQSKK